MDVLRHFEKRECIVDTGRVQGLPQSKVRTICENAGMFKKSAESVTSQDAAYVTRHCNDIIEKIERLLAMWINYLM